MKNIKRGKGEGSNIDDKGRKAQKYKTIKVETKN